MEDHCPDGMSMPCEDSASLECMRTIVLLRTLPSDVHMIATRDLCPLRCDDQDFPVWKS